MKLNTISQIIYVISIIGFVGMIPLAIYIESLTKYHLGIVFVVILIVNFLYQLLVSKDIDDVPHFRG